jgi:hypothetical protein
MLGQGKELAAIDFASVIGGPLVAVINAQAQAARVTTNFINEVAFESTKKGENPKLRSVDFEFNQVLSTQSKDKLSSDSTSLKVPLISMLPIPYIRVANMTIDLNITLHDVQKTTIKNDFTFKDDTTADFGWFGESVNMTVSVTEQNTYQNDRTTDDTYGMRVTVNAVQDEMPAGLKNILGIFQSVIQQQASLVQAVVTADVQSRTEQAQKKLTAAPATKSTSTTTP